MNYFYKACLSYCGTHYQGWQKQAHSDKTIQGQFEIALKKISQSESIKTIGCGRTDSGVHAIEQWVSLELPLLIDVEALERGLNSLLPEDIHVRAVSLCDEKFHPVFSATKKEYRYYFTEKRNIHPFNLGLVTGINHSLDLVAMNKIAKLFIGKHDFAVFSTKGTEVATTTREIFECEVIEDHLTFPAMTEEKVFCFRVVGEGFLKQMVRLMVAAVWRSLDDKEMEAKVIAALRKQTEKKPAPTAPPQGLYLYKVFYP